MDIEPSVIWCARHGRMVKDDMTSATIILAGLVAEDARFVAACGGVEFSACSETLIAEGMTKLAPLCCLFDDETIAGLAETHSMLAKFARAVTKGATP